MYMISTYSKCEHEELAEQMWFLYGSTWSDLIPELKRNRYGMQWIFQWKINKNLQILLLKFQNEFCKTDVAYSK